MDVYNPSNLNRVTEYKVIAISFAHVQRDASNIMQLVDVVETLGGEDCVSLDIIALNKSADKSVCWLRITAYQ